MTGWQITVTAGLCVLLIACSRREGVSALSPVFAAKSSISASEVADCVVQRWRQSTRQLHRSERAGTIILSAESFFRGVPVGLRIVPDGRHSRVEYFRQRRADPLYSLMVRGCLHPRAPGAPQS